MLEKMNANLNRRKLKTKPSFANIVAIQWFARIQNMFCFFQTVVNGTFPSSTFNWLTSLKTSAVPPPFLPSHLTDFFKLCVISHEQNCFHLLSCSFASHSNRRSTFSPQQFVVVKAFRIVSR